MSPAPVLHLHAVTLTRRAGVAGCRAAFRALFEVDLTVWPGDRVLVVGAPHSVALLLLTCAGQLRPDAGTVWVAPGAAAREVLRWAPRDGAIAELAVGSATLGAVRGATRVLRLRGGRLHELSRVDSASGAA